MVFQPEQGSAGDEDQCQVISESDLAALMAEDAKRREAAPTIVDEPPIDHARQMTAAVRTAALDVQPNPNEAALELGHLQKLVRPLMILIQERDSAPGKSVRPLHKLKIKRPKTSPMLGDEQYLTEDIKEIKAFMKTQRYEQLAAAVKESVSTYLQEQEQSLQRLAAEAEDVEADRTEVIKPPKRPAPEKPQGLMASLLKRIGLR